MMFTWFVEFNEFFDKIKMKFINIMLFSRINR